MNFYKCLKLSYKASLAVFIVLSLVGSILSVFCPFVAHLCSDSGVNSINWCQIDPLTIKN